MTPDDDGDDDDGTNLFAHGRFALWQRRHEQAAVAVAALQGRKQVLEVGVAVRAGGGASLAFGPHHFDLHNIHTTAKTDGYTLSQNSLIFNSHGVLNPRDV